MITRTQQAALDAMDDMYKAKLKVVTLNKFMYDAVVKQGNAGSLELKNYGVHRSKDGFKYKAMNIVCRKPVAVSGRY